MPARDNEWSAFACPLRTVGFSRAGLTGARSANAKRSFAFAGNASAIGTARKTVSLPADALVRFAAANTVRAARLTVARSIHAHRAVVIVGT